MPSGVYKRSEETLRILRKGNAERKKEKEGKENKINECNGKENILHTAIDFLEKTKEKGDVDVSLINGWQKDIKTLGEAIAFSFNEAFERKHRAIRKVWFLAIKAKEEDTKIYEEILNQVIKSSRLRFPEAKITISLCKEAMMRNKLGQFEVIKEEKE